MSDFTSRRSRSLGPMPELRLERAPLRTRAYQGATYRSALHRPCATDQPTRTVPCQTKSRAAHGMLQRNAAEIWGDKLPDLAIWNRRREMDARTITVQLRDDAADAAVEAEIHAARRAQVRRSLATLAFLIVFVVVCMWKVL
jgi:hypothetical protein